MSVYAWSAGRPAAAAVARAGRDVAVGALAAASVGLLVGIDPFYALLPPAALVAVWFVVRPRPAAVALGASIPAIQTVASGHLGLHIGVGDPLLVLLVLAAFGAAVLERDTTTFTALRPVALPALQYSLFVGLLFFVHPGSRALLQTVQRYELIAFPLVVGSYIALRGAHMGALKAYLLAATVLALVFPFNSLGLQKNPAGQFVANAILLIVGVPQLARYRILVPLLVYGLFSTQSRGAILACAVGLAILLAFRWMHSPRQALATALAIAAVAVLAFQLMPPNAQSFITSYGSKGKSHAAWNIRYRKAYERDALSIIRAHPWLGIGVGSYPRVVAQKHLTQTDDPHDVVLLQAAEGGWGFAASFVILILGTIYALLRLRQAELAAVAVAILLTAAVHGLVDEYWVRGVPVLGWLLVGMACVRAVRADDALGS